MSIEAVLLPPSTLESLKQCYMYLPLAVSVFRDGTTHADSQQSFFAKTENSRTKNLSALKEVAMFHTTREIDLLDRGLDKRRALIEPVENLHTG